MIIHGIIACGGNSERYAQSVGEETPFPKHLQEIGGKTLLTRSFEALIYNVPEIKSVTFALNRQLEKPYIEHMKEIQKAHPEIQLSFTSTVKIDGRHLFTNIKTAVYEGVYDLSHHKIYLGNPIVAIALGDSVVRNGDTGAIQTDLNKHHSSLAEGSSLGIFQSGKSEGLIYWFSRLNGLGEGDPDFREDGQKYGLSRWNCNTKGELTVAKRDLGYPLTMDETALIYPHYGKERR